MGDAAAAAAAGGAAATAAAASAEPKATDAAVAAAAASMESLSASSDALPSKAQDPLFECTELLDRAKRMAETKEDKQLIYSLYRYTAKKLKVLVDAGKKEAEAAGGGGGGGGKGPADGGAAANAASYDALVMLATALFRAAQNVPRDIGDTTERQQEFEILLIHACKYLERAVAVRRESRVLWLFGEVLYERAKGIGGDALGEKEDLLIQASQKFLEAYTMRPKEAGRDTDVFIYCAQQLVSGAKERRLEGSCQYVIAGMLVKQGGQRKNWKERWFVLDDAQICYYKSKADWESGPVAGGNAKPQGTIDLNEVIDTGEPGEKNGKGPKTPTEHAFEITTYERPYLICANTHQQKLDWQLAIDKTLKFHKTKKKAMQFLEKQLSS